MLEAKTAIVFIVDDNSKPPVVHLPDSISIAHSQADTKLAIPVGL